MGEFVIVLENVTEGEEDDYFHYDDITELWRIGVGVVVPITCCFGIVGNLLSLLVLTSRRFTKAAIYSYLRFMVLSDLLAMIICIPQALRKDLYVSKIYSYYFAHVSIPLINMLFGTSGLLIVCMSLERFIYICHPAYSIDFSARVIPSRAIPMVFILSITFYVPMVLEFKVAELEHWQRANNTVYEVIWNKDYANHFLYRQVYSWIRAVMLRFLPFIIVITLNTITIFKYKKIVTRRRKMSISCKKTDLRKFREENNRMVILACTAIVFVTCLAPMPIAHGLVNSSRIQDDYGFQMFLVIGDNLEVLNAALNFYMYCIASKDFRKSLHSKLTFLGYFVTRNKDKLRMLGQPRPSISIFSNNCEEENNSMQMLRVGPHSPRRCQSDRVHENRHPSSSSSFSRTHSYSGNGFLCSHVPSYACRLSIESSISTDLRSQNSREDISSGDESKINGKVDTVVRIKENRDENVVLL